MDCSVKAMVLLPASLRTSTSISNKLVNDLPLVVGGAVRSPFDLAVLTPESKNLGGDNGFSLGGGQAAPGGTLAPQSDTDQQLAYIVSDIQDFWAQSFSSTGKHYPETKLVLFSDATSSGCGRKR